MHAIVFSPDAVKLRAFFADVLDLPSVDAGGGWLIFALPPAELAVHPADGDGRHELYLMCDDIHATLAELQAKGVEVARDISDQGWGLLAAIRLPDGEEFPVYQPRHPSPLQPCPGTLFCRMRRGCDRPLAFFVQPSVAYVPALNAA
jgi:catechol 2,3-dioxygenase-like lactoylglutathione lyase family enzyme